MPSSPIVAFRTSVMIACLVAVPLAAVLGTSLPQSWRDVIYDQPRSRKVAAAAVQQRPPAQPRAMDSDTDSASISATNPTTDPASLPGHGMHATAYEGRSNDPISASAGPRQPATMPRAAVTGLRPLRDDSRLMDDIPLRDERAELTGLVRCLRRAGATYHRLETWGNLAELYRFSCDVAVAKGPDFTRHFEATARDPLEAVQVVLEQVESWRAGGVERARIRTARGQGNALPGHAGRGFAR